MEALKNNHEQFLESKLRDMATEAAVQADFPPASRLHMTPEVIEIFRSTHR